MNFTEFKKMATEFQFNIEQFNFDYTNTIILRRITVTETLNSQISVIRSQNQHQPIVPIHQLFQGSSQLECCPADVGSNERRPNPWTLAKMTIKNFWY